MTLKEGIFADLKALAANQPVDAGVQEDIKGLVGFATGEPGFNL